MGKLPAFLFSELDPELIHLLKWESLVEGRKLMKECTGEKTAVQHWLLLPQSL